MRFVLGAAVLAFLAAAVFASDDYAQLNGPGCEIVCSDLWDPVCATADGEEQTFANDCQIEQVKCYTNKNWVKKHNGRCPAAIEECNQICTYDYSPICAECDGVEQSFVNECALQMYRCANKEDWVKKYDSVCQQL